MGAVLHESKLIHLTYSSPFLFPLKLLYGCKTDLIPLCSESDCHNFARLFMTALFNQWEWEFSRYHVCCAAFYTPNPHIWHVWKLLDLH